MDRDQLIDLTRRALKLARDKTTDLTPAEHTVAADTYTSAQRHAEDKSMLLTSPQLVGYSSELPRPGTYGTKTVMGRSILLTRSADNTVRAFDNVCLHRQSRIADGCGAARRLACPYHAWTYDLDGNLVGVPGKEGFPETRSGPAKLTELPAAECAGFLWISLDRDAKSPSAVRNTNCESPIRSRSPCLRMRDLTGKSFTNVPLRLSRSVIKKSSSCFSILV